MFTLNIFLYLDLPCIMEAWVNVFRIIPEFRIMRLTFHRKSAPKCSILQVIIASDLVSVYLKVLNLEFLIIWRHTASFKF